MVAGITGTVHGPFSCSSVVVGVCEVNEWPETSLLPCGPEMPKGWTPLLQVSDSCLLDVNKVCAVGKTHIDCGEFQQKSWGGTFSVTHRRPCGLTVVLADPSTLGLTVPQETPWGSPLCSCPPSGRVRGMSRLSELWPHFLALVHVPRSSAIRRSVSTSPLGFARASPSPPPHAEHGVALARKLSLGGGRPYTPSPQGESLSPWWVQPLNWDGTGRLCMDGLGGCLSPPPGTDHGTLFCSSWNHPRAPGLEWGALPTRSRDAG